MHKEYYNKYCLGFVWGEYFKSPSLFLLNPFPRRCGAFPPESGKNTKTFLITS